MSNKNFLHKITTNPQMANYVTIARLLAVPVIILLLQQNNVGFGASALATAVYFVAALTDLLDGYLARKYNLVSTLGKFLDPLVDKLLVSSALIMMIPLGRVPAWVVFMILAREFAVTGLRAVLAEKGEVIAASESGKQKTLAQNLATGALLWHYSFLWADAQAVGTVLIYLALALTYWSGIRYFWAALKK